MASYKEFDVSFQMDTADSDAIIFADIAVRVEVCWDHIDGTYVIDVVECCNHAEPRKSPWVSVTGATRDAILKVLDKKHRIELMEIALLDDAGVKESQRFDARST